MSWAQNLCEDERYLSLLKKGEENLTDKEFDYFIELHSLCEKEKRKIQAIEAAAAKAVKEAREEAKRKKESEITIAVFDFENNGLKNQEVRILSTRLESELVKLGKYNVVERSKIDEILKEQKFQISGCVEECMIEVGKMLGAKQIILGSVGKLEDLHTITVKLVDVTSGELVRTSNFDSYDGLGKILTIGLRDIAFELAKEVSDEIAVLEGSNNDNEERVDGDKYIVTINSVFLSKDDFRKDIFGKRFYVYILVYNDRKVILNKKIKMPYSDVIRLDESKTIVYNNNSTYSIKFSDDPTFNMGNDYWIKSEQDGWIFDKGKISFGKNSFIELSQIKLND